MELILKSFIAFFFGLAILSKLTGKTKSTFDKAGYSLVFLYGLAFAELVGIIGLFTQYEFYAILGLFAIMLGAIFTLFRQNAQPKQYIMVFVAIILLASLFELKHF